MKILVADPRRGRTSSELFVLSDEGELLSRSEHGYVPEFRYHPEMGEIVVIEGRVGPERTIYHLHVWDADTLAVVDSTPIPTPPTYAGFAGRSVSGSIGASRRYIYFLRSGPILHTGEHDLTFRLIPCRFDRREREVEQAAFAIDSCRIDFGLTGDGEENLYAHLACELPSAVLFGTFSGADTELVRMVDLPCRVHGPMETNGSWRDKALSSLYCINRRGYVYAVDLRARTSRLLTRLPLAEDWSIPVHNLYGSAGDLYAGVARGDDEQGAGMASEVWRLDAERAELRDRISLSQPAMNFAVSADGKMLIATAPYQRTVFAHDVATGEVLWERQIGDSPGEIVLLE